MTSVLEPESELDSIWITPKSSKEESDGLREIVNGPNYQFLRDFLSKIVLAYYRDARSHKDERTHTLNSVGKKLEDVITMLDAFAVKPKTDQVSEPFLPV